MDLKERESLVRRIVSGKLYCTVKYRYDEYVVTFQDPTLELLTEADWIYRKEYDNCVSRGGMITISDSLEILKKDGQWSDELDKKLVGLYADIKQLRSKLDSYKFQKIQQRAIKDTIEKGKEKIIELESKKNQLYSSTIEAICEIHKRNFVVSRIANVPEEAQGLMRIPDFLDTLSSFYYEKHSISEKAIRELARLDPWRLYWVLSKDTGTPLFKVASEITYNQYAIVSWSRVYDFAYASDNRPDDDTISDDDKFDAWYEGEVRRLDSEHKRNALDKSIGGNALGGQELFIPADIEGAKEVYDLNDKQGRIRIAQRQKAIEEKGELHHAELPDVNADIKMESNRLGSQGVMNRSK